MDNLKKSKSSPFKKFNAIFLRKEYQALQGNLSHGQSSIELSWHKMDDNEKQFVQYLVRASICNIIKPDEISACIEQGIIKSSEEVDDILLHAMTFLLHICNDACKVLNSDQTLLFRMIDNLLISDDNTKHIFKPFPNNYSVESTDFTGN